MQLESRGITAWDSWKPVVLDVIDTQQPATCLIWELHNDLHEHNFNFLSVYHILHDFRRLEIYFYDAFIVLFGKSCAKNPQYSPFVFQMRKKHTGLGWHEGRW